MPKRPYIRAKQRRFIIERARSRCEYCQTPLQYASQSFVIEHIVPLSRGGETAMSNLALACGGCNAHKYTKVEAIDPVSHQIAPLYNPRMEQWHEHFGWNEDYTLVIGLTPVGRATVEALRLNRKGLVNLRRLLRLIGKHPPEEG